MITALRLRRATACGAVALAVLAITGAALASAPTAARWQVVMGGSGTDRVRGLTTLPDGSTLVVGSTTSPSAVFGLTTFTGLGQEDAYVARMRSDGTFMWVRQFGGAGMDQAWGAGRAPDGSLRITGYFVGPANFGAVTNVAGVNHEVFIASLDAATGDVNWVTTGGGSGNDYVYRARVLSDGSTLMVGSAQNVATFGSTTLPAASGAGDWWAAQVNADGTYRWVKRVGGSSTWDDPFGFDVTPDGSIVATGYHGNPATFGSTTLPAAGSSDATILKLDNDGDVLWARNAGGSSDDFSHDIVALPDGSMAVTGYFRNTMTFHDGTQLQSAGGQDAFVARYDGSGGLMWAVRAGGTGDDVMRDIALRADGRLIIGGLTRGPAQYGSTTVTTSAEDMVIAALSADTGTFEWAVTSGGPGNDWGRAMSFLSDGSILLGGHLTRSVWGSSSEDAVVERWLTVPDEMPAPVVVRANGGAEAAVTITPIEGDAITQYIVTATPATGTPDTKTCAITPPATTCTIVDLNPLLNYTYAVTATNAAGSSTSDASPEASPEPSSDASAPGSTTQATTAATAARSAIRLRGRSWRVGLAYHTAGRVPDGVTSVTQTIVLERSLQARFTRSARASMTVRCPIAETAAGRRYRCTATLAAGVWRITTTGRAANADVTGFTRRATIRVVPHQAVTG